MGKKIDDVETVMVGWDLVRGGLDREQEEAFDKWPGLRPGRDCKVYGHQWTHTYPGGGYCHHCGAEF